MHCNTVQHTHFSPVRLTFSSTAAVRIDPLLQCVAVCCSVLQCVAVCCNVLQCVAVTILSTAAVWIGPCCSVLQCFAAYCSALQCIAVHCSVCTCALGVHTCGCMRVHMCVYVHVCLSVYVCMYVHACMRTCVLQHTGAVCCSVVQYTYHKYTSGEHTQMKFSAAVRIGPWQWHFRRQQLF